MVSQARKSELLFSGSDWNFAKLSRVYDEIEALGTEDLGLDIYPVQMEVISSEQMLD
ncbi:MAG: SpoVR family protein, partial [Mesorhizobium sp.]